MTIVFFGTSSFSATILERLALDPRFKILSVVTVSDKPVGRRQEVQESAVAQLARALSIPVHTFTSLKTEDAFSVLSSYKPDFFLVAAYGKIIPQNILDIPNSGSINIHASLLPQFRGASPIHSSLLAGESVTGVSIMAMDAEVDHGPVYTKHTLEIESDECEPQLEARLASLSAEHIADDLQNIFNGSLQSLAQDHTRATYTKIISKNDGQIDWNNPATFIYNQFRAYYEWPGIFTFFRGKRLKILDCQILEASTEIVPVGTVRHIENIFSIQCGLNSLQLLIVQPEGKQPMLIQEFVNGHKNFIGANLESSLQP